MHEPQVGHQMLNGLRVAILVADGFEQEELVSPREALEAAGASTRIVGLHDGKLRARDHGQPGAEFDVTLSLDTASPMEFDALLLPGGKQNGDSLRSNERARKFASEIVQQGKPVSAICHGTALLIDAGIARGHHLTGAPDLQSDAEQAGAAWEDRSAVVDGNLVSSRGPQDLPAFNQAMLDTIEKHLASSVAGTEDEQRGTGSGS